MFLENQEKKDCCGCTACSQICPRNAIRMRQDRNGFFYPAVSKKKCVECGLCETVCPMREDYVGQDGNPDIYALKNKDEEVLRESSSGGMFSLLAEWILGQGGVVYGVAFDEKFHVRHERAETMDEAARFRTSKYVDSELGLIYADVKKDLEDGKTALFTGTPCQVMGLKKYLRAKKVDVRKLYTCDNICHGVPSRMIWEDYLHILREKYIGSDDEIVAINMRSKKVSWKEQVMDIRLKKRSLGETLQDFSFNRFFSSLFGNRPSCFHCKYTSYKRPGDFTLGDFWNVENAGVPFDVEGGVNVVLVNSEKGRELFEKLRDKADVYATSKEACWQPHLEYSAKAPAKQKEFWRDYHRAEDKEQVIRTYLKGSLLTRIIRRVSPFLRKTGLYGFAGKMYKKLLIDREK